jgi:hemerythrin-like domain-containing protein
MRPPIQPIAPRIDDPIELLLACHEKVRRFADLTVRVRDHVAKHGADKQAQEAAQSILRYFNIAAPLHHDDEEQDLFPALRTQGIHSLNLAIDHLATEHLALGKLWKSVQGWLDDVSQGAAQAAPSTLRRRGLPRRIAADCHATPAHQCGHGEQAHSELTQAIDPYGGSPC